MATPLMFSSLNIFQRLQASLFRQSFVIAWNPETHSIYWSRKWYLQLRWFFPVLLNILNIIVGVIFLGFVTTGKVNMPRLIRTQADQTFFTCYGQLISMMTLALEYSLYKFRLELSLYINILFSLFPYHIRHNSGKEKWYSDPVGCAGLSVILCLLSAGLLVGTLTGMSIVESSMMPIVIDFFYPPEESRSITFFLVKFTISFVLHVELYAEIGKVFAASSAILLYVVNVHLKHIQLLYHLSKVDTSHSLQHFLQFYRMLLILHSVIIEPASLIVAVFMGFGFYVLIISLCLCIYGWGILSPLVFPVVPSIILICVVILVAALPLAPKSIHESSSLLKEWGMKPKKFKGSNKYLERLFISLRPTEFSCGQVGVLNGERSTTYVGSIMENSVTCLLLFGNVLRHFS